MFIAMSHWFGSRPLTSATPHQDSSLISCCCLDHGDPVVMILQDQPLHTFQKFIDEVDVGVGQLKSLNLGLGGS